MTIVRRACEEPVRSEGWRIGKLNFMKKQWAYMVETWNRPNRARRMCLDIVVESFLLIGLHRPIRPFQMRYDWS